MPYGNVLFSEVNMLWIQNNFFIYEFENFYKLTIKVLGICHINVGNWDINVFKQWPQCVAFFVGKNRFPWQQQQRKLQWGPFQIHWWMIVFKVREWKEVGTKIYLKWGRSREVQVSLEDFLKGSHSSFNTYNETYIPSLMQIFFDFSINSFHWT